MTPALDPVIHPIQRLRICALLDPVTEEEFAALRDLLETSDSALSKQLSALAGAGYASQRRATRGGRSRVWVQLTPAGRRAFHGHVAALTALANHAGDPD
ncbi:transcriptional regulator [Occultella gossypii]|uniref:Transcriptional regulator n=1 Tax=Occultella gossypii TaxID=2800820 RepID=A0ABS7S4N3_9MICO|nr:transcriptional regulator [Occultella gossypii]MBZ2195303.1 transcriptional regulator [Occultella gossypii]